MNAFIADVKKEITLLIRDWMGLIFLFFMPILEYFLYLLVLCNFCYLIFAAVKITA